MSRQNGDFPAWVQGGAHGGWPSFPSQAFMLQPKRNPLHIKGQDYQRQPPACNSQKALL